MKRIQKMSDSELEVMRVVWAAGGPVTSARVHQELAKTKDWKLNTVITFLARLMEKGILTAEKNGRGKPSQYRPLLTESEYKQYETRNFLNTVHDGSVKNLITALYDGDSLNLEDLEDLRRWFDSLPPSGNS